MKQHPKPDTFSSEEALISFLRLTVPRYGAKHGIGDDAAIISASNKDLVVTTDSLVESVHFRRDWVTPLYLGKKAARANLSDIAAMGATPTYALVSLVLPKDWYRKPLISALYDGFLWAFVPHKMEIIGGNVSSGERIVITLTLLGILEWKPLLRSGARVGDSIFCTGTLGMAGREVSLLLKGKKKRMEHVPPDRIIFAHELAKHKLVTACIDISDGLAVDLARLCSESNVGANIAENALPLIEGQISHKQKLNHALFGGEDYELLFTARKEKKKIIQTLAKDLCLEVIAIGEIQKGKGIVLIDRGGKSRLLAPRGWDHLI